MTSLRLITAPTVEPFDLADAKTWLRITWTDANDDARLTGLITSARQFCESWTGRAFLSQVWRYAIDDVPVDSLGYTGWPLYLPNARGQDTIELPRPPLISVTSAVSFDQSGVQTTFDPANYWVDAYSEPGRLALRDGSQWPAPLRSLDSFVVTYTAGYGATADLVPEPIKQAMRMLISHLWEAREGQPPDVGSREPNLFMYDVPISVRSLLYPFKVREL